MFEVGVYLVIIFGVVYGLAFSLEKWSEREIRKNEEDDE